MSETDLVLHILLYLPEEYETKLSKVEGQFMQIGHERS